MKATKILAGLSATAFAASLITMVSASAATEVKAENFGAQVYVMGNGSWNWQSVDTKFSADGKLTLTGNAKDLAEASKGSDATICDAGIQFYMGDDVTLADGETVTATVEYKLTGEGDYEKSGSVAIDFGGRDSQGKIITNTTASLFGYDSNWADFEAIGDFTLEATIADVQVNEGGNDSSSESEVYELPQTVDTSAEEYSDWGSQGSVDYKYFANLPEGKDLQVTVNYKILGNDTYHILSPRIMSAGWPKLTEYIKGLEAKENYTDEQLKEYTGDPLLQADGSILVYNADAESFTFTITAEGVAAIREAYEENNNYGGLLFSAYDASISSVTVAEPAEVVECPCGCGCTSDTCKNWDEAAGACGCGCADVVELDATLGFAAGGWYPQDWKSTTHIEGDGEYTLSYTLRDDDGNVKDNDAYDGAVVLVVDIADVYDGAADETIEDRELLYPDFEATLKAVKVDGQEINFDAAKVKYGNIENNKTNYRIEIYNEYGDTKAAPPINLEDLKGTDLDLVFDVSGLGDMSGICSCHTTSSEDSSSEADSSSEGDSSSDATTSTGSSSAAGNTSSTTSSQGGKTDTNPSTGAAALGAVGVILAGAAMAVSKKKD